MRPLIKKNEWNFKLISSVFISLICFSISGFSQDMDWKEITKLPKPMRGTAITSKNSIYFMEANKELSGVYRYNYANEKWDMKTHMVTQGWNINLAAVDSLIYAIGGDPFRKRNECYNPKTNKWDSLAPMPTARQHSNCSVANGKIYVMGGIIDWGKPTDKNEMYDPQTNSWQTLSPIPEKAGNPILAAVKNKIYALCGRSLYVFDPLKDQWEQKKDCPEWIGVMFGSAVIGDKIIIPGGQNQNGEVFSSVYIYDTNLDRWAKSTSLPKPIQLGGITTLAGKIYLIGGCDPEFEKYDNVFEGKLIE